MDSKKKNIKFLVIAVAAALTAVLIFFYTYYNLIPGNKKAARDGAVVYSARSSSLTGIDAVIDPSTPLSLELRTDGRCFLTNADGSLYGKWSLDGERIQVRCGKLMLYGTKTEDTLRLHEINGRAVELCLTADGSTETFGAEKLEGEWRLTSITVGEDIYTGSQLNASGYKMSVLKLSADGSGTALLTAGIEKPIRVDDGVIEYDGRLLGYSFTDTEIYLQYADGVLFVFEKRA